MRTAVYVDGKAGSAGGDQFPSMLSSVGDMGWGYAPGIKTSFVVYSYSQWRWKNLEQKALHHNAFVLPSSFIPHILVTACLVSISNRIRTWTDSQV
jgi:hypothetical protein